MEKPRIFTNNAPTILYSTLKSLVIPASPKRLLDMSLTATHNTKVFISYAHEDIEPAQRLYKYLRDYGLEPWLDRESLLPGQKWKPAIKNAIRLSRYFIPLFSSNSVEGRGYVQRELRVALDILDEFPSKDIFVIPVRLNECKVSEDKVNELHIVDLFPDWENGTEKILKAMNIDSSILRKGAETVKASRDDEFTSNLSAVYWNNLLSLIDQQKCIPFIGPAATFIQKENGEPSILSKTQIANSWMEEHGYPFQGSDLSEKYIEEHGFPLDGSYQLARVGSIPRNRKR